VTCNKNPERNSLAGINACRRTGIFYFVSAGVYLGGCRPFVDMAVNRNANNRSKVLEMSMTDMIMPD